MPEPVFGRTNRSFPRIWLSLSMPDQADSCAAVVEAAVATGLPIDISSHPALWGGFIRGTDADLMTIGGAEIDVAVDSDHAGQLIQAHLIETLCGIGREHIDFYFLKIDHAYEEFQLDGALQALDAAREEGHVRYVGLACTGSPLAALATWQFHDAFDAVLVPRNPLEKEGFAMLSPLAAERRVGIVTYRPLNWGLGIPFPMVVPEGNVLDCLAYFSSAGATLVGVRTPLQVAEATAALDQSVSDRFEDSLAEWACGYKDHKSWQGLLNDPREWVAKAARKVLGNA